MKTRLTKSEMEIMEVLWDAGKALTTSEIVQRSKEKEWKDSSVHLLIKSLMDKDVIKVEGFKKTTKNYARTFIPVKNREEFLVGQIIDKKTTLAARKRIYSYLIEKESNLEMIEFIQKLLEERKEEIKVKQK
jgi:BlaI family penicillinase repressor